jgi:hypothetical protein
MAGGLRDSPHFGQTRAAKPSFGGLSARACETITKFGNCYTPDVFLTSLEKCGAMSSKQKSEVRIFFDHLYFSACCVLVGCLLIYCLARWTGHGFDLDDNIAVCVATVVALSLILTAYLTYMSISRAPSEFVIRTKREK